MQSKKEINVKKKIIEVELLRIISSLGIVYFHSGLQTHRDFAYSGLIVFTILSLFLLKYSPEKRVLNKILRLGIPYAVWFLFYGLFNLYTQGQFFYNNNYNFLQMILNSPSIHLWYLPFIMFITIIFSNIKIQLGFISWFISILLLLSSPLWREFNVSSPIAQYLHVLPAVFLGLFYRDFYNIDKRLRLFLWVSILVVLLYLVFIKISGISIPYVIGFLLCSVLLFPKKIKRINKFVLTMSSSTFGIYLVHPLFLFIGHKLQITNIYIVLFSYFTSMVVIILFKIMIKRIDKLSFLKLVC